MPGACDIGDLNLAVLRNGQFSVTVKLCRSQLDDSDDELQFEGLSPRKYGTFQ